MSDTTVTNRMIAERAGWTNIVENWEGVASATWLTNLTGSPPDDSGDIRIPDYLHSVDAALTLPLDNDHFWQLWGADGNWECTVVRSNYTDQRLMVMDDTAPLAICRAWWRWMEAQEAE